MRRTTIVVCSLALCLAQGCVVEVAAQPVPEPTPEVPQEEVPVVTPDPGHFLFVGGPTNAGSINHCLYDMHVDGEPQLRMCPDDGQSIRLVRRAADGSGDAVVSTVEAVLTNDFQDHETLVERVFFVDSDGQVEPIAEYVAFSSDFTAERVHVRTVVPMSDGRLAMSIQHEQKEDGLWQTRHDIVVFDVDANEQTSVVDGDVRKGLHGELDSGELVVSLVAPDFAAWNEVLAVDPDSGQTRTLLEEGFHNISVSVAVSGDDVAFIYGNGLSDSITPVIVDGVASLPSSTVVAPENELLGWSDAHGVVIRSGEELWGWSSDADGAALLETSLHQTPTQFAAHPNGGIDLVVWRNSQGPGGVALMDADETVWCDASYDDVMGAEWTMDAEQPVAIVGGFENKTMGVLKACYGDGEVRDLLARFDMVGMPLSALSEGI
jgi:hypothetical protein